ncbi:MAG: hypothetical protein KF838_15330 [Phycisphaeraceae bacterium]|nr:MAG: hypothetical protein KF838_15330 [Phycisphaeraceae bacterium]
MKRSHGIAGIVSAALLASLAGTSMAQTVTVSGGAMTINTSAFATDQQMEIEVGPVPGEVRLSGVIGAPATQYFGITSIDLTAGPRNDYVEFRIFTGDAPAITANTGAGNSDVKVIYNLGSSIMDASSSVSVTGGTGEDKVLFEVVSFARAFAANWVTNQGAGTNETVASIDSPEASQLMSVSLSSTGTGGKDTYDLSVKSNAASINVNASPNTGAGNDSAIIAIDTLGTGTLNLATLASLGAGIDVFELTNVSRGGPANFSGSVNGGADADTIKFSSESNGRVLMTFNGALGNDTVDFFAKGSVTGRPRLLGAGGDDYLKLVVDGPRLATPFIDGGAGYDRAFGFGTIVNCEEVN